MQPVVREGISGRLVQPWRKRHKKEREDARCCWVCGKLGGQGFTTALRLAGYEMKQGEMGYAHSPCIRRVRNDRAPNRS